MASRQAKISQQGNDGRRKLQQFLINLKQPGCLRVAKGAERLLLHTTLACILSKI
jgi:hypothetical protein